MAAEGKKSAPDKRIAESERFRYIGFDVYPGKPKDLFKGEAERNKYVDAIRARREKGDVTRDDCKLYEKRVSGLDRIVLTLASLIILGSLFLPWFSAYNEVVEETQAAAQSSQEQAVAGEGEMAPSELGLTPGDTAALATPLEPGDAETVLPAGEEDGTEAMTAEEPRSEEVIVGMKARKKIHRDYENITGLGILAGIGSVGSLVFSSGFILMLTGLLVLVYILASIGLPIYTLYGLHGIKGNEDQKALGLKKVLKLNWIPVVLFVVMIAIAFIGAEYGFDPAGYFTSLDDSYSVAVLFGLLSWGIPVTLAGFILLAVKGIEI